jgi:hypothetical protein
MLNAKPFTDGGRTKHTVKIIDRGLEIPVERLDNEFIRGNPVVHDEIHFSWEFPTGKKDEDGDEVIEYESRTVTPQDLKKIDPEAGTFTYVLKDGTPEMVVLVLTREAEKTHSWQDYSY